MGQAGQVGRVGQPGQAGRSRDSSSDAARWAAVMARDARVDGQFVYAVKTTGVFCRPSCPSRRPRPENVRFFVTTAAAEAAGFRSCRRCRPTEQRGPSSSSEAMTKTAAFLDAHADRTITLSELAAMAGLSPAHFQRTFTRTLGMSPRQYQAACRARRFRGELRAGQDVTSALYEAGYGSPSRIYETPPTGRGLTPSDYRRGGAGMSIAFTSVECDLGWLLMAATARGICAVKLGDSREALEDDLRREFPAADVTPGKAARPAWLKAIVQRLAGSARDSALPLDVRGTAFQWRVWRALQAIPSGETRSYADVARAIGRPSAVRAVARACATNPVCLIVPCHRVVATNGALSGYRWGADRKARLLAAEARASRRTSQGADKAK